jgi:signal peptidase I
MKTAVRWFRRLLDLALVLLVVAVLGLVLAVNLGPRLGHDFVVIRGGSMEPAIHLGAVTEVSQVAPADLRPGDVVTLKAADGVVVSHRITRILAQPNGTFIETRGDANAAVDPVLTPVSDVMGRVDFSIPVVGYLIYLLTLPIGVLSVLGLALTLLFAIWLLEDFEEDEEEREEQAAYESELARVLDARQNPKSTG